jgi:hypothetical protein
MTPLLFECRAGWIAEHPQNVPPAFGPRFADLNSIPREHTGHEGAELTTGALEVATSGLLIGRSSSEPLASLSGAVAGSLLSSDACA